MKKIGQNIKQKVTQTAQQFISDQRGMATIEYAMVLVAAATLAGILIVIVKSGAVHSALENIITNALKVS
jgi:Flp pilus assembly pilin Flp